MAWFHDFAGVSNATRRAKKHILTLAGDRVWCESNFCLYNSTHFLNFFVVSSLGNCLQYKSEIFKINYKKCTHGVNIKL